MSLPNLGRGRALRLVALFALAAVVARGADPSLPLAGEWTFAAEREHPAGPPGLDQLKDVATPVSSPPEALLEVRESTRAARLPAPWLRALRPFPGVVWQRVAVDLPEAWRGRELELSLGVVDDTDVTWFDGARVGGVGADVPEHWLVPRVYRVPGRLVVPGRRVIAVRITNERGDGGFVGLPEDMWLAPVGAKPGERISLATNWREKVEYRGPSPGDRPNLGSRAGWQMAEHDDSTWEQAPQPGAWGDDRDDLAGVFWVSRRVELPPELVNRDLVVNLGVVLHDARAWWGEHELARLRTPGEAEASWRFRLPAELALGGAQELRVRVFSASHGGAFLGPENFFRIEAAPGAPVALEEAARIAAGGRPATLRWEPTQQKAALGQAATGADLKGPDGLWYPDFRYAGIPGGIPDVPVRARGEELGVRPDTGAGVSTALEAALNEVARRGGGALLLAPGTYLLDRPILIMDDRVVLRGAGAGKTILVSTYAFGAGEAAFFQPTAEQTVLGFNDTIQFHAAGENLKRSAIYVGDRLLEERRGVRNHTEGTPFNVGALVQGHARRFPEKGRVVLRGVAEWRDGRRTEVTREIDVDLSLKLPVERMRVPFDPTGIITIVGDQWSYRGRRLSLAQDAERGDRELLLGEPAPFNPGEVVLLNVPFSDAFQSLVESGRFDLPRRSYARIVSVEGARLRLDRPLRMALRTAEGATVETQYPIREVGIEHLTLRQARPLWTHGIQLQYAERCWVRGVNIEKIGRNPIEAENTLNLQIEDCVFDDAWFKGGGGTGYVGWSLSTDSLMQRVEGRNLRHAPNLQAGAVGCVIRESRWLRNAAQYHQRWASENLLENNFVDARGAENSYGPGLFVQRPEPSIHGPGGGPRNVIWGNTFIAPRGGIVLGGMNEAWMINYNVIYAASGPGLRVRMHSFDHIVRGNVFALGQAWQPLLLAEHADCVGIRLEGNRLLGASRLASGWAAPALAKDNVMEPETRLSPEALPPAPVPVPSLLQWQLQHYGPVAAKP